MECFFFPLLQSYLFCVCTFLTRIFTAIMPMVAAGLIPDDPTLQPIRRLVSLVGFFFFNVWYRVFLLHDPLLTWTAGCILIGCLWDHRSTKCQSEWPVSAPPTIVLRAHPRVLTFSHLLPYCYYAKPIITHQKTVATCNFNQNLLILLSLLSQPIDNSHQCF